MKTMTYEDVENRHLENLKSMGYSEEEIPRILEQEKITGILMEDRKSGQVASPEEEEVVLDREWLFQAYADLYGKGEDDE